MKTELIDKNEYEKAVISLKKGNIVALPTETVMGFAIDAFNKDAFQKLIDIKNRPSNKAFPFVVQAKEEISKYSEVGINAKKIINHFFPGPLTIILKKKSTIPDYITSGKDTIAVRIPNDETVLKILNMLDNPILLTSANKSGEDATLNSHECYDIFNGELEYIIQGKCIYNEASTIIDLTNDSCLKIVRQGKITKEDITRILEDK